MKIMKSKSSKKLNESILVENDENILDGGKVTPEEVKDEVETVSDQTATVTDSDAKVVADELNKAAKETGAENAVIVPVVDNEIPIVTRNKLTSILDSSLYHAKQNKYLKVNAGCNVLISGLPGSGKTGIVADWAKYRNLKLININVKDDKVDQLINGLPMRDITATTSNAIATAKSNLLVMMLNSEPFVLFLDEFNRQTDPKIRASLLTLINEHRVVNGNETLEIKNLLFVICAMNPAVKEDLGATQLNGAELSRFPWNLQDFDSDPRETHEYFSKFGNKIIDKILAKKGKHLKKDADFIGEFTNQNAMSNEELPPVDFGLELDKLAKMTDEEAEKYFMKTGLIKIVKILQLADAILNTPGFKFDGKSDLQALQREQKTIFNKRLLTDALLGTDGNIDLFIYWVKNVSNLLEKDKQMLIDAAEAYRPSQLSDDEIMQSLLNAIDGGADAKDLFGDDVNVDSIDLKDELDKAVDNLDDMDEKDLLGLEDDKDMFAGLDNSASGGVDQAIDDFAAQVDSALGSFKI